MTVNDYRGSQERFFKSPVAVRRNTSTPMCHAFPAENSQSTQSVGGVNSNNQQSTASRSQPTTPQQQAQRYLSLSMVSSGKTDRV